MRVTTQMSYNSSLTHLTSSYSNAMSYSDRISSMKQVLNLQDDPSAALTGIKMANLVSKTQQYIANIDTAVGSLSLADANIGSMKSLLDSAMDKLVGAANEVKTSAEYQTLAAEMNSILQSLLKTANAKDGDRYMFGGTASGSEPYGSVGKYVVYGGNDKDISVTTGDNTATAINTTGADLFGSLATTIGSGDLNPGVSLATDVSTSLSALNGGSGVPAGKIVVYYSAYPDGLEMDLTGCDTLEDVKDVIERTTLEASRELDAAACSWLDGANLDWHDLQDRYVKVTLNPDGNGISLQEFDLGEPLPEPTAKERKAGLAYSGNPGYAAAGDSGVGAGTVHDKADYIYGNGSKTYAALAVDNCAGNRVATALGIKGTANKYDPANPDARLDGFIHGADLNPAVTKTTLLADLEGYNDAVYTITNGDIPGSVAIRETSDDVSNVFSGWNLSNLSQGYNTGSDGQLYARVTRRGAPDDDIYVELYAVPLDKATTKDLVATGTTTEATGGTVVLTEANGSGVGGSVGIHLPTTRDQETVNLAVEWEDSFRATVHVPAFVEETNADGTARDYNNLLSGWSITGLDRAPAAEYDLNHPPSTDLDGDMSVNMRLMDNGDGTSSVLVEIYRPSYDGVPAALVASGELRFDGALPSDTAVSGRIALVGEDGFDVGGSVYLEIPAGMEFADGVLGASEPTTLAYQLADDLAANTEIRLGGSMELVADQTLAADMVLKEDTFFPEGTTFTQDIALLNGYILPAGAALPYDATIPKGQTVGAGTVLPEGTVLYENQIVAFSDPLAAGTVVPAGSQTTDGVTGFPADGMISADAAHAGEALGFGLTATFATVEDLMRAVEEKGIYATVQVSDDGKGIEFASQLSGAHLTVSEDTDCYEQLRDTYQQLSALDLNGLVKGVNTDDNGDLHTEVVYYPPDANRTDGKVMLLSEDGEQVLIDAGYYVRVYSDADALNVDYENRDNSSLVAEGFIPAGEWDAAGADPLNPFLPVAPATTVGSASPLVLEERNGSGVSGTVNFDYYGGRDQAVQDAATGEYDYDPYDNAGIVVSSGGLRSAGSAHATIQEIDLSGFSPGTHCDYAGTAHATIGYDQAGNTTTVSLYRDASRTHMTAKGELNAATGDVILYETDKNGEYTLDIDGNRIEIGSLTVAENALLDGQTDSFTVTIGGLDTSGRERESNVFSTIADIIDAMNAGDGEALHNLIAVFQADIDRLTTTWGEVSARTERLEITSDRYSENIIQYQSIWTANVGMDDNALAAALLSYQAAENAYNAAMTVSSRYMNMRLIDYL